MGSPYPVIDEVVRYVGQPLAVVVARSEAEALDTCQLVKFGFEKLPPIVDLESALAPESPLLHPEWGTNLMADVDIGDSAQICETAMAGAAEIVDMTFRLARVVPAPMEPRGVVAS